MKVTGKNPETGEEVEVESEKVTPEFIKGMSENSVSEDQVKRLIDSLDISADAKSLLYSFSQTTIRAGEYIIKIGRKIIDFVCLIFEEYPSASFGAIFGAIAGFLIASIPLIGAVLGPIFAPIAIAIGLVGGLREDLKDKAMIRRIAEANASFSPLAG